ncbi:MAG: glycosyltransferase [Pseudomonadales bacterium]|nr:glycosyltransferase [Pseudomonadales bacterium]
MNIWLLHIGELLPIDDSYRLFRYGMLADALNARGHHVVRWAPTFSHVGKVHRVESDQRVKINSRYDLELVYAEGYKKNISFKRILFYSRLAQKFSERVKQIDKPDIIVTAVPSIEWCEAAIKLGEQYNIPVIVDVRDLWPDIFASAIPKGLGWLGAMLLTPMYRRTQKIFRKADGIVGVSKDYLDWGLKYADRGATAQDAVFPLSYTAVSQSKKQLQTNKSELISKGVDLSKIICCFAGQFEATYDVVTIINTARLYQETRETRIQFVLCGDGAQNKKLKDLAKGLKNIFFMGWVDQFMLRTVLDLSRIGLVSYAENAPQSLPNKPFEYMSGGLALVSSLRGELDEIIDSNKIGCLYQSGNAQELGEKILGLVSDIKKLVQMEEKSIALYNDQYRCDKVYGGMVTYLEKMSSSLYEKEIA